MIDVRLDPALSEVHLGESRRSSKSPKTLDPPGCSQRTVGATRGHLLALKSKGDGLLWPRGKA